MEDNFFEEKLNYYSENNSYSEDRIFDEEESNINSIVRNFLEEESNKKKIGRKRFRNSNYHSKRERDNILRKIKVDFHKYIIKVLNREYTKGKKKKKKFYRFASYAQNDVTIKTNKLLLNLPISVLLTKVEAYKKLGYINKKLYNKIKKEQCSKNKDYFSLTYSEFYTKYLRSKEVEKLKKKREIIFKKLLILLLLIFKESNQKFLKIKKIVKRMNYIVVYQSKRMRRLKTFINDYRKPNRGVIICLLIILPFKE